METVQPNPALKVYTREKREADRQSRLKFLRHMDGIDSVTARIITESGARYLVTASTKFGVVVIGDNGRVHEGARIRIAHGNCLFVDREYGWVLQTAPIVDLHVYEN